VGLTFDMSGGRKLAIELERSLSMERLGRAYGRRRQALSQTLQCDRRA
jgi:hypothetical protein